MISFIRLVNQFIYCLLRWFGCLGGVFYLYSLQHELFGIGYPIPTEEEFLTLLALFTLLSFFDFYEQVNREKEEKEEEDYE